MIQVLRIALMLAVLFLAPLHAQVQASDGFTSGSELLLECEQSVPLSCLKYLAGLGHMHSVTAYYGRQPLYCMPDEVTVYQAQLIVVRYLRAHPEWLHYGSAHLATYAFAEAFPCPR
jgi:Rap1a immunity proteins